MTKATEQAQLTVNPVILQTAVRQALADEMATVLDWSVQALDGGFSGSMVQRWQGQAQTAGATEADARCRTAPAVESRRLSASRGAGASPLDNGGRGITIAKYYRERIAYTDNAS